VSPLLNGLTFGLMLSPDNGASWRYVCEAATRLPASSFDPRYVVTGSGAILGTSAMDGVMVSRDRGCTWNPTSGMARHQVSDLLLDGTRILATTKTTGMPNGVFLSTDDGASFALASLQPGPTEVFTGLAFSTAMGGSRGYAVSSDVASAAQKIYRTADAGATWTAAGSAGLPANEVWLVGADPTDPMTLYVLDTATGQRLLKSTDGGDSFTAAYTPMGRIGDRGKVLVASDGSIWLASTGSMIVRSMDRGATFQAQPSLNAGCLGEIGGVIYACTTPTTSPFNMVAKLAGGQWVCAVPRSAFLGPLACPAGTTVATQCGDWSALRDQLFGPGMMPSGAGCSGAAPGDGGVDGGSDAILTEGDGPAGVGDGGGGVDAGAAPKKDEGCTCAIGRASAASGAGAWLLVAGALGLYARRCRRRSTPRD
jgi:hypothetical protein